MPDEWAIIDTLENGETAVAAKRGCVELLSYNDAHDIVSHFAPDTWAYSPNGAFIAPVQEFLEESWQAPSPPLRVVDRKAIPRTDYDPKSHDTFHLRLVERWRDLLKEGKEAMTKWGLVASLEYPGSALDVMDRLLKLTYRSPAAGSGNPLLLRKLLAQAHPIIWSPFMTGVAQEAVLQLQESLTVEPDVMFLNPMLWLYCEPMPWMNRAEISTLAVTKDGHIPLSDEEVWDMGAFGVARLFHLSDQRAIEVYTVNLVLQDSKWNLEVLYDVLEVGDQPSPRTQQLLLKLLRFAASPYLIVKKHKAQRATIRRTEGKFPVAGEGIGVILLRRALYQYPSREHREGEPVPWSCQWWVSGHWKRQWYPSLGIHRPLYISPYIKGPPDKPLKGAVRLVVR